MLYRLRSPFIFLRNNWLNLIILTVIATIAYGSGWLSALKNGDTDPAWWSSFLQNFSTEMIGAVVTFALIEMLANRRADAQDLIIQMRSRDNATAVTATERFVARNWHRGTLLKKVNLRGANLANAFLQEANLQQADLWNANLQQAYLTYANLQQAPLGNANLQQADLWSANLQQANLRNANLQQADLRNANLQQADLQSAKLQGANLNWANLHEAHLEQAKLQEADLSQANLRGAENIDEADFDEKTVLPDAMLMIDENLNFLTDENGNTIYDKYWTADTDMSRYTDPKHPDFWEPDYLKPGYRGFKHPRAKKQAKD